jgi:autotransporter-associated beta strand protein
LILDGVDNLLWVGNSLGEGWNIWQVGATPSGSFQTNSVAADFYGGDNVTFDDTYVYSSSVWLGNVLTPTLITVNASRDYTFGSNGVIAGSAVLLKSGTGRLSFSNNLAAAFLANPYTGGTIISNGLVYVQAAGALGTGPITLAGGGLETLGKLVFTNDVFVTANSTCQLDQSGNQSIGLGTLYGNPATALVFTNASITTNQQNWVTLSASFTNNSAIVLSVHSGSSNNVEKLVMNVTTNVQVYNGAISDVVFPLTGGGGVIKQGAGAVYLNAVNTYTVTTTNIGGLLAGSGSISSPLEVYAGASLGAGPVTAIGTFTVSNKVRLSGNVFIRVNKLLAQSNDLVSVTGTITNAGTGTVTVTNIGATALNVGDSFRIFSGAVSNGTALTVSGGGVNWVNNLAVNGSIQVLSIIAGYPTNINYTVSGGTLTLSWPATHLGWILQNQTNSLSVGIRTNWFDMAGTASITSTNITVVPTNPSVFYRLRSP